jgi:hypothetical protein
MNITVHKVGVNARSINERAGFMGLAKSYSDRLEAFYEDLNKRLTLDFVRHLYR